MKIRDHVVYSADNKSYKIVELFKANSIDNDESVDLVTIENDKKEIHYVYLCDFQKVTIQ